MCNYVLKEGGEKHSLRGKVVRTILWQVLHDRRVDALIYHLIDKDLIAYNVDPEDATSSLDDYGEGAVLPIINRFNEIPETAGLQIPPSSEYIDVFYENAFHRLVDVLSCNQLLRPKNFNIDIIQKAIVGFLQEY